MRISINFIIFVILLIGLLTFIANANAAEPSYCSVKAFKKLEVATSSKTKRLRAFQVGDALIQGLAVGGSDAKETAKLAPVSCIWYFNEGNKEAEQLFNHEYFPGPYFGWIPLNGKLPKWLPLLGGELTGSKRIADDYEQKLNKHADKMVQCIERGHWVGGCDGQRHRGPSVFAWLLALSGCSPDHAEEIASELWGRNGVPEFSREEIAERGWKLGNERPELRKRLQEVLQ